MKRVTITEVFDAYPEGTLRSFASGDELELADDFADMLVGKGLARDDATAPAAPEADHHEEHVA